MSLGPSTSSESRQEAENVPGLDSGKVSKAKRTNHRTEQLKFTQSASVEPHRVQPQPQTCALKFLQINRFKAFEDPVVQC